MASWILVLTYFLSVSSLFGNGMVIYLMAKRKRLHSSANAFITSLAVADFCVGLFIIPSSHARNIFSGYQNLRMFSSFQYFLFYSSACNLCVVTADRFVALTLPLRYVAVMTWSRVYRLILTAWIIPLIVYLLPLAWIFSSSPETKNICEKFFIAFLLTLLEFLPCVIMVAATVRLFRISCGFSRQTMFLLSQLKFNHPNLNVKGLKKHRHRNMASAKLISLVVGLFVLCYVIEMVASLLRLLNLSKQMRSSYFTKELRFLFLIANSAVNPLVYAFLKKDIQTEVKRFFCRHRHRVVNKSVAELQKDAGSAA